MELSNMENRIIEYQRVEMKKELMELTPREEEIHRRNFYDLMEENRKLYYTLSKKWRIEKLFVYVLDENEIESAYGYAMTKAIQNWDLTKEKKFSVLLGVIFDNEIKMLLRKYKNNYKDILFEGDLARMISFKNNDVDGFDSPLDLLSINSIGPEREQFLNAFDMDKIYTAIANSSLKEREKNILLLRFKGKSQKEISETMGISRSYVSRIENKVINNLKKYRRYTKDLNAYIELLKQIDPISAIEIYFENN